LGLDKDMIPTGNSMIFKQQKAADGNRHQLLFSLPEVV
jgi:hypothetical protein